MPRGVNDYDAAMLQGRNVANSNSVAVVFPPPITDGLVLHLDAGNFVSYPASGTTWFDLSGRQENESLVNGPTFSTANGGAIVFDGTNDYVSSVSIPNPNGQLTLEIAMNYNSTTVYRNIFDNSANRPMLWINTTNKLESSIDLTTANAYNGQNVVVTTTYNSSYTPGSQIYVNGSLVGTYTPLQTTWANPATFTLFNRSAASTFSGSVFSVKFYNRVLNPQEILQNFNATRARFGI